MTGKPDTPRERIEDALYDAAVITDIIQRLASAGISSSDPVCPTMFAWLGECLQEQHELITQAVGELTRRAA